MNPADPRALRAAIAAKLASDRRRLIQAVWEKGQEIPGWNPAIWRYDAYGGVMKRDEHGNRDSEHGWEMDHIVADALGGPDAISNLRPLSWRNNLALGARTAAVVRSRKVD